MANDPSLEESVERARVYRSLAGLFRTPDEEFLLRARQRDLPECCVALEHLGAGPSLVGEARELCDLFERLDLERLQGAYRDAFDESSAIRCAPTEMDQLDGPPQLEMTRTFEMADVAGFYRAFCVAVEAESVRVDHIATELEFMNLLAVKEVLALQEEEAAREHFEVCRNASRAFLRDHLGRWAPRLGESLSRAGGDPVFSSAGRLLRNFVPFDAERIDAMGAPVYVADPLRRAEPPEAH